MTEGMHRVAIVTGASSGIGKAVAIALLKDGYKVALLGRRRSVLEEVAKASGHEDSALVTPADVSDSAAVADAFAKTVAKWGRVDLLFNNAGINTPGTLLEDLSDDAWESVVNVNLNGMFYALREAFRVMKTQTPQGGRIINNGSIAAYAPRPNSIAYTATKHAVSGLTKAASLDGRKYDIAVGQIDIGNAATDMADRMQKGILQAHGAVVPEATMDVEIVAKSVLYMASLPLEANVLFHTVMANKMPYIGRG